VLVFEILGMACMEELPKRQLKLTLIYFYYNIHVGKSEDKK
jgi:hypothetical protein